MKLLLDTHIFIWSVIEPQRLKQPVSDCLNDAEHELWISPITLWETMILVEKNRLKLALPPVEWLRTILKQIPFREALLNHEVALQSRQIKLPHQDPADRFLVATALVYELTLVTADEFLVKTQDISILANL